MNETNLSEAFGLYNVKPARRARSAMTQGGDLVISCRYAGFKKAQVEILRYEEDLAGETGEIAQALRVHLAEALSSECEVRVIVAVETVGPKTDTGSMPAPRTTYYARKDLVGRVSSFDGERFVVDFRREQTAVQRKASKGTLPAGGMT